MREYIENNQATLKREKEERQEQIKSKFDKKLKIDVKLQQYKVDNSYSPSSHTKDVTEEEDTDIFSEQNDQTHVLKKKKMSNLFHDMDITDQFYSLAKLEINGNN